MLIALAASIVLMAGQSQLVARKAPPLPPPYQGAYQPLGVDEIGIWQRDDESERALAASNLVIRDEKLNTYVKKILCDTVGTDRCNATRLYIMREPSFNATMSPNGTMRVFSGLLLRVHNEAELGAILGHEFAHFEKRHGLERFKSARDGTDVMAWAGVLASIGATYTTYNTATAYRDLNLSIYGSLYRFQRDQEREADALGIGYLNQSQLPPQVAATVWTNLTAEIDASAAAKGLKKPNFDRIAFTATHPPQAERAANLTALAQPGTEGRPTGADRYRAALASWLPVFLDDQIKLNDFGGSEFIIQSLAQNGWTAALWHARGELYRARGAPRNLINAAEFYANAIALDPTLAESHRGLGLSLLKTGRTAEGQAALRRYLALKPGATDARMIAMMLPKEGF